MMIAKWNCNYLSGILIFLRCSSSELLRYQLLSSLLLMQPPRKSLCDEWYTSRIMKHHEKKKKEETFYKVSSYNENGHVVVQKPPLVQPTTFTVYSLS